ncbi:MAG: bifunctional diaminohydroxyphosphoribosylaminopyrimidine deaminase/5-amino-6-(5-phosphoribosylamino)uracil reductase RibD [Deltaproteobacteria bacterium]
MEKNNEYYMNMAIQLALKARGMTSPNPVVGAVIIKNGSVVGRGYHRKAGAPHAETLALDEAKEKAKGAALYVTLEPCAHFGRTPPCVNRIISSGIRKVVIGMVDPNPLNNGKGINILKMHNISVESGVCREKVEEINEVFVKYITKGLPFVTVKVAQSLDGKIATSCGESKWITSDLSRNYAHRMRQYYDGIIVGVNTVRRDNPRLDAWFSKRQPVKVVVDSKLSTPDSSPIFEKGKVILATIPVIQGQETENRAKLSEKATILEVKEKNGQVNLKDMLKKLARMEITNVLVEGGGTLIGSLFDEGLVDKVLFFVSPKIIGGAQAISSVMGKGVSRIDKAVKLEAPKLRRFGEDILFECRVKSGKA